MSSPHDCGADPPRGFLCIAIPVDSGTSGPAPRHVVSTPIHPTGSTAIRGPDSDAAAPDKPPGFARAVLWAMSLPPSGPPSRGAPARHSVSLRSTATESPCVSKGWATAARTATTWLCASDVSGNRRLLVRPLTRCRIHTNSTRRGLPPFRGPDVAGSALISRTAAHGALSLPLSGCCHRAGLHASGSLRSTATQSPCVSKGRPSGTPIGFADRFLTEPSRVRPRWLQAALSPRVRRTRT